MARQKDNEPKTQPIRVAARTADMLEKIAAAEDIKISELVDIMILPQLLARFERIKPQLEKIEKIKAEIKKARTKDGEG